MPYCNITSSYRKHCLNSLHKGLFTTTIWKRANLSSLVNVWCDRLAFGAHPQNGDRNFWSSYIFAAFVQLAVITSSRLRTNALKRIVSFLPPSVGDRNTRFHLLYTRAEDLEPLFFSSHSQLKQSFIHTRMTHKCLDLGHSEVNCSSP